jgi:sn1-specific diacylglycerol lipase
MFGTQEVAFSLAEFRASVARALVAWVALQDATSVWGTKRCLNGAKEIPMSIWKGEQSAEEVGGKEQEDEMEIIITSDEQLPDDGGTLVQAQISHFRPPGAYVWAEPEEDIQEPEPQNQPVVHRSRSADTTRRDTKPPTTPVVDWAHLRPTLRRMSHLVIGGYGGASFLFFGLAFPSIGDAIASTQPSTEPSQNITNVVHKAESEARASTSQKPAEPRRTWWGLITGRHDQEIFERFAGHSTVESEDKGQINTAVLGDAARLPRFWVLTDHARRQVVLVLRGECGVSVTGSLSDCDL